MKNILKVAFATAMILSVSSCADLIKTLTKKEVRELDYLDRSVKMDIEKFFDGDLEGFAIRQDASGKIVETFTVKIDGKWEENKGVVQFKYTLNNGTKNSRTWLITTNSDGSFDGTGHDVVKPLVGKQMGNAAQLIYSLNIKNSQGGKEEAGFVDDIYLIDEKSAILISEFESKSSAGKIILSIRKIPAN